jgi:hypothetical protein
MFCVAALTHCPFVLFCSGKYRPNGQMVFSTGKSMVPIPQPNTHYMQSLIHPSGIASKSPASTLARSANASPRPVIFYHVSIFVSVDVDMLTANIKALIFFNGAGNLI